MYARLARYSIPPDEIDRAVRGFEDAGRSLQELDGLIGGYLLLDHESGTTMTLTLWESQAALADSETRAAVLRQRAVREVEGSCEAVNTYEVALEFGGHTRDVRGLDEDA